MNRTEWAYYYDKAQRVVSLAEQMDAYKEAINSIDAVAKIQHNKYRGLRFILGGFFPHTATTEAFLQLGNILSPHSANQFVYFDMNTHPFRSLPPTALKIQARLERLPFAQGSVDFLFLDRTFNFMSPDQMRQFAESASQALSPQGIICATFSDIIFIHPDEQPYYPPLYEYSPYHVDRLVKDHLKSAFVQLRELPEGEGPYTLHVFARKESDYATTSLVHTV